MTDKTRWLLILCLAQCFIMLVFINYSAVLPLLKQEWRMTNTMAGSIFSVYQLGYIASGVVLSALTDRINTRNIFIVSILWSATANLLFALYAHDYASAMVLRALTGVGMGGTYMPGLKLVAEKFPPRERGRAVGIYVGALVLGVSLSLAVTGTVAAAIGWRGAFVVCSAGVFVGALLSLIVFRGYRPAVHAKAEKGFQREILTNRPAFLMIFGYGSHMWEMYGMRSWLAPFIGASFVSYGMEKGVATGWAATAAAVIIGIGALSTASTGT
ncbi:MAG TPA: MFS transporter, partial [Geobacteraceae bacterium]